MESNQEWSYDAKFMEKLEDDERGKNILKLAIDEFTYHLISHCCISKEMMEKLVEMEEAKQESPQSDVCLMAMERISISLFKEGYSIMRPSFFNGENYFYWKNMMKLFIQSNDYHVLKLIVNGPNIPTKEVNEEIGRAHV